MAQISNGLIKLTELNLTQIKNRFDVCVENSKLYYVRKHFLLDGIIGTIAYDQIEWFALLVNGRFYFTDELCFQTN